eukprot:GHVU01097313.1.p3 GENE.GHVU01097313.1~~GHVU01097313.1.p3  ORF type:complete len:101 (+),score=3.14 GHVU01097313.1:2097-2399(+)
MLKVAALLFLLFLLFLVLLFSDATQSSQEPRSVGWTAVRVPRVVRTQHTISYNRYHACIYLWVYVRINACVWGLGAGWMAAGGAPGGTVMCAAMPLVGRT